MRRFVAVAAMLAATALFGWLHPPVNLALGRGVLAAVPAAFGPWTGTEMSFGDGVAEDLKADDLLLRRYARGADDIWLCLVYHQNRRYGSHDPQTCYESQGFVVTEMGRARVDDGTPGGLEVGTFVAERKHVRRVVWYWWTTDGLSTRDATAYRRRLAFLGAFENRSWGSFVRVESVARDGDMAAAVARVRDFASRAATTLPVVFRRALRAAPTGS
jgi:EpsI family protein